jgi:hypothetical protein
MSGACARLRPYLAFWLVGWLVSHGLLIALMVEAARASETLVKLYQTTRCYNPEDSHLHTHRRENLKSYIHFILGMKQSLQNAYKKIVCKTVHCNCHRDVTHQ